MFYILTDFLLFYWLSREECLNLQPSLWIYFSFQRCQFLLHVFWSALIQDVNVYDGYVLLIDLSFLLIISKCPSLSLVIVLPLSVTLLEVSIAPVSYFWLVLTDWKLLSHIWLFTTPWSVHEILQARILEWIAMPFSRDSSQLREQTRVSCIASGFFTVWATRD